jgi:hypothetical protein
MGRVLNVSSKLLIDTRKLSIESFEDRKMMLRGHSVFFQFALPTILFCGIALGPLGDDGGALKVDSVIDIEFENEAWFGWQIVLILLGVALIFAMLTTVFCSEPMSLCLGQCQRSLGVILTSMWLTKCRH